jgi:eukaryotic-like serine/threonine-protein kinase
MEKKDSDRSSFTKAASTVFMSLFASFMGIFTLFLYVNNKDVSILVYGFIVILVSLGLPLVLDFLKAAATKGIEKDSKDKKDDKVMERIENLEALMCRLDAEINTQLEQTLSGGKVRTLQNVGDSQMPTIFLNIATALETRFQLLKEIGRGGMGIVFQAHDKQLKEQVAIKVLSPLLSNNADGLERLKREVSAARRITHPNVIRIHDISESGGLHFVSMEYFSGTTLKDIIKRDGPFSGAQGSQIAFQICDGLESAHKHGVIHRDLKSQNIIVNDHGELKIIDFGLATSIHQQGMTATGLILGTPEYMAPEQVAGKKADERADIYSFGIILYELFTGKVPFTGETAIAVGFQQMRENPTPPRQVNPQISTELERIILKALQKSPYDRYSSVPEMRSDLEKAFQAASGRVQEPSKAIKSRSQVEIE